MKRICIYIMCLFMCAGLAFAHPKAGKPHKHPAAKTMPAKEAKVKRKAWCKTHPKKCQERRAKRKAWCKQHPKACAKKRSKNTEFNEDVAGE